MSEGIGKVLRLDCAVNAGVTLFAAAALLLQGCAGSKKAGAETKPASGTPPVAVQETSDLPEVAKAIKTKEDSLILDLLLGYRMLLLRNPDPKSLDKETLKRSRDAYDRLEAVLRHGGIRAQEGGERVYSITNEDKLSLQEVLRSASTAAGKAAHEGDWDRAKARWKEILGSKQAVTWTMEEAQWGLALAEALESPLPDAVKKKLNEVNEDYAAEKPQDEIGKEVKDLLDQVQDEKLRKELKKLANRAWERDKRAGRLTAAAVGDTGSTQAAASPAVKATEPAQQMPSGDSAAAALVDTLTAQGKYLLALKSLERAGDQAWVKQKKAAIGDRFCEEKRRDAANSFKDFKKAPTDSLRRVSLKRTASDLDSCLFYFPDISVTQKVRRNREMVEGEMKKLK
jgi:hypothetical protein